MDPWRLATKAQRRINALTGVALAGCALTGLAGFGSASNGNTGSGFDREHRREVRSWNATNHLSCASAAANQHAAGDRIGKRFHR